MNHQYALLLRFQFHNSVLLLDAAAALDPADYTFDHGYSRGSIHQLLGHTVGAAYAWRTTLARGAQAPTQFEPPAELEEVRALLHAEQAAWEAWLEQNPDLEAEVELRMRSGAMLRIQLWRILQHIVLHSMQHHSEVALLLARLGQPVSELDFILYATQHDQTA